MYLLRKPSNCNQLPLSILMAVCFVIWSLQSVAAETTDRPLLTLDENVWATFYDLPSRRFRTIRDAFIRKDFDAVEKDLQVSIGFLSIEVGRAVEELVPPLTENVTKLESLRTHVRDQSVSVGDLDAAFARAHWLLAQHYLVLAMRARDAGQHKSAGHYLWATAHHLERTVLWSDARIDGSIVNAVDSSREMGGKLQTSKNPARVYRDRPIASTAKTLIRIGEHLDRKVWVRDRLPVEN